MSVTNVAINGFGRIGRLVLRAARQYPNINVVAINDPSIPPEYMAYMMKYDTVHGRYEGSVDHKGNDLIVDGKPIRVFGEKDPTNINWSAAGANSYIVEATGIFTKQADAAIHLKQGDSKHALIDFVDIF